MAHKGFTHLLSASMALFLWLMVPAWAQTDTDILNFALQLECLEGEFYNYAAGNGGLPASDRGGGPAPIGGRAAKLGGQTLALAKEIALNEKRHVEFLRSALGSQAVPCPLVNLTAFGDAFNTAVAPNTFNPPFSPFNDDLSFLLATFLFEDYWCVCIPRCGATAKQQSQPGSSCWQLCNRAVYKISDGLAALRAKLGGGSNQGVTNPDGSPQVVPVDGNSQTIPRTTAQIIAIGTGGSPTKKGLFFPNGLNGSIK
ncbi:hypothetical protein WJX74_007096 [Apatococcus lobatus]|uniref:Uncharacterized protein n=1 Tax=Apatococcus lobatus TaxID=904363 RepID=A0AAW1QIF7_9CHLO